MTSETGVAFAKNAGMVVVYYRLEGLEGLEGCYSQQTFKEVISASAQLHKCPLVLWQNISVPKSSELPLKDTI